MKSSYFRIVVFIITALLMWACSDNGKNANVTFSMKSDNNALSKVSAADTVIVDTAKFLISRLKLNSAGENDSSDVKTGPFAIIINLVGAVTAVAAGNIPAGTYDRVKFELHKADQNEDLPDPDFRTGPGGNERYSGIIIGRFNGVRFVYRVHSTINESMSINPPIVIADSVGTANVTLVVNPTLWFKNNGAYLDPNSSANESQIENSIKDSFKRAMKDHNKDGTED